mmetsp:Transcript_12209/g.18730  ORF Transcript_12209/g.18730 Transcript_12209/m.18730 type:complete len:97 (-) Transcript_12209:1468-1758(-)
MSAGPATAESIICNDPNGLCLVARGEDMNPSTSGVYTSLWNLASKLEVDDEQSLKRVVIETTTSTTFVKEFEGHTVACKVPTITEQKGSTDSTASS